MPCAVVGVVVLLGCGTSRPAQKAALTEPTLAAPSPTGMLHDAILKSVCPPGSLSDGSCATCPHDEDLVGPLTLVTSRTGSYSEPGVREHLVMFDGCVLYSFEVGGDGIGDDRPLNTFTTTLFRESDGTFEEIGAVEGLDMGTCIYPEVEDGTEAIFCVEESFGLGEFTSSVVRLDPLIGDTDVYTSSSTDVDSCPSPYSGYLDDRLLGLNVEDVDGDGLDDVVVEVSVREGEIPDGYSDYCEADADGRISHAFEKESIRFIQADGEFEDSEYEVQ